MTWLRRLGDPLAPFCDHCHEELSARTGRQVKYTEVVSFREDSPLYHRHFCSKSCRDAYRVIRACMEVTGR